MTTDLDIIGEAYAQQIKNAWTVLYGVVVTKPSEKELHAAEQKFVGGIELAGSVRAAARRAVELLQKPLPARPGKH
ncbi:hypothetical protein BH20VER1_BH20VER1_24480 [soil metagenome]